MVSVLVAVSRCVIFVAEESLMRYLRQNTATVIVVGPFVDWQNGKSLLRDQADFVPADIVCELVKGSTSSELTLTKTGGSNDIVLTGKGLATLELTAANVDTLGHLRLSFTDKLVSGFPTQTILSFAEDFMVMPAAAYDALFGNLNVFKYLAAFVEGTWNLKTGSADTWQISDAENKDVPIMEVQVKEDANPYKQVMRL
jgi:hypothetical protein